MHASKSLLATSKHVSPGEFARDDEHSGAGRKPIVESQKQSISLRKYLSCTPLKSKTLARDLIICTMLAAKDFVLGDKPSHFLE